MFTGIVEAVGILDEVKGTGGGFRVSIHTPRKRPVARSRKNTETAYVARNAAEPEYPASSVGIHTYTAASTATYRNAPSENART